MRCFTAREVRLASFAIGSMESVWASTIWIYPLDKLSMLLELYEVRILFVACLAAVGAMLMVGAVCLWRKMRHLGLLLSPMITFPTFGILIGHGMADVISYSLPLLGALSLLTFFQDAKRKPRATVDN